MAEESSRRRRGGEGKGEAMAQADLRRVERRRALLDKTRFDLNEAIRVAAASGESYRDIAKCAKMSKQRVAQIVNEK